MSQWVLFVLSIATAPHPLKGDRMGTLDDARIHMGIPLTLYDEYNTRVPLCYVRILDTH